MTTVQIRNTTEAKQIVRDALNLLDAVSAYSINHQLPSDQLFDIDTRKRLQSLHSPKLPSPIHSLLEESDGFTKEEKKKLSPYCYKIENLGTDFDNILDALGAYYELMHVQHLTSKGKLIDTIIRSDISKTFKSVAKILDIIGSLALWHIREVEARALATKRGHNLISQEDKSDAATEMWQHLSSYNSEADRAKLDTRIFIGIRWNRFLDGKDVGIIVAVHPLPHSLKSHFTKLIPIVADLPGILDRAKKATPCVQKLLDSRLGPWMGSKKRQLSVQSVSERITELHESGTEADSGTPGANSIGALLNAAEHIATATACEALDQRRKRRRVKSFPLSKEDGESATRAENPESVDSTISDQGGTTEETSSGVVHFSVLQVQPDNQVEAIETNIAEVAEVGRLGDTLGDYLFKGMDTSQVRNREKDRGMISFTETVRLHFGSREGEDFKLEVWLCSSVGKAISQARKSIEDLRSMLDDYLFDAMKASIWRREEERKGISGCTGAVDVSFPNGEDGSDCIMGVMLNFVMGMHVFRSIYRGSV